VTRVLHAIVAPPHLTVSGAARAGELLASALARHCDVAIASMLQAQPGAGAVDRHPVRSYLPGPLPWDRVALRHRTPFYRSDIPALVRRGGYDLVHLHNPMPALEMRRVARACIAQRTPYVVSTHGFNEIANGASVYGFGSLRAALWNRLILEPVKRVVRDAAGVFALSEADIDIVRSFGFAGRELSVVGNGVLDPEPAAPDADAETCRRFGLSAGKDGTLTCMFLANHTPNKGLGVLLEALGRVGRPLLLILGGEKRPTVDYDAFARACGPGQRIVVTGRLSDREVSALYRRADLFVFPTLADTFPLVVLEAMAHGLPVLASRVGGIPHQIDDRSGAMIEPGDAASLAAQIERFADLPRAQLATMGSHARQRVRSMFTWEHAADLALAGYRRVLAEREPAPARALPVGPILTRP